MTTMRIDFFVQTIINSTAKMLPIIFCIKGVLLQAMLMKLIWYLCNIDQIMATQYETELHFRFYLINFIS